MITLSFQMKGAAPFEHVFPDDCEIRVGRGAATDPASVTHDGLRYRVRLPLATLSEEHALVTVTRGVASITDCQSRNGTLVRLSPGASHVLREWPVSLGSEVMVYLEGAQRSLPDGLERMSPEALRDLLRGTLASDAVQVTLGPRVEGSIPLMGDSRYLTLVPEIDRTVATEDVDWVRSVVNAYNASIDQRQTDARWRFVARSPARRATLEQAVKVAPSGVPVLLVGPMGSGRGVLAQDLHENGRRSSGPFVSVDCASSSPLEVPGDLESAEGGTLFLHEIDALNASAQARLAWFLARDNAPFERGDDLRTRPARARVIASTSVDLRREVAAKRFREDLYDELHAIKIVVPAPDGADRDAITADVGREARLPGSNAPPPVVAGGAVLATLPVQPSMMGRLLSDILFLSVAMGGHARSELAARLHMTFQGVDGRLTTLGVTPGDVAGITLRLRKAEADFRACVQQHGALKTLLEGLSGG